MNSPDARTEFFRSSWSVYDDVVARNYMFHREIHECVRAVLGARHARGGYSLLDLGCGNARWLADSFREFPPLKYVGVDLSRTALNEAAIQLRALPSVELHEQDMLACALDRAPASFDVIYSGFAMHHLPPADKQRLFQACASILAPGGEFLLVDVVREEGQRREEYLDGYLHMVRTKWPAIDRAQIEEICRHVADHDFPETSSTLAYMAAEAGLTRTRTLDRFGPHYVLVFSA